MKSILACVDGTSTSEDVLAHTASFATGFKATSRVIRVVEAAPGADGIDPIQARLSRVEANAYVRDCVSFLRRHGVSAEAEIAEGDPAEVIVSHVDQGNVDLVVMGRGRSSPRSRGLGLNASFVADRTAASVFVAPSRAGDKQGRGVSCILAGVDGSPSGEWAAFHAALLAQTHNARLLLVHAVVEPQLLDPYEGGGVAELADELVRRRRVGGLRYVEGLRRRLRGNGITIDVQVLCGPNVNRLIQDLAEREGVDLVVVGASGWWADRAGEPRGSVAEGLLRRCTVPVLVCRPKRTARRSSQPTSSQRSARTPYSRTQ